VAELIAADVHAERVRENLARVREQIALAAARAGRDPAGVQVLAATKYIALEDLPALAHAGVRLVGENRAQDLHAKVAAHGELFTWHFIGQLQSRRVPLIVPHVRLVHSLASESALQALERHRDVALPDLEVLVQVNVAREPGKAGVLPEELPLYLERSTFPVAGLPGLPRRGAGGRDDRQAGRGAVPLTDRRLPPAWHRGRLRRPKDGTWRAGPRSGLRERDG
jgi:uncharacterized pyridoxal phosphate-containing UPF0001 family protein